MSERTPAERDAGILLANRKRLCEYHEPLMQKAGLWFLSTVRAFANEPCEPWLYQHPHFTTQRR
jgi:hypothetical protein